MLCMFHLKIEARPDLMTAGDYRPRHLRPRHRRSFLCHPRAAWIGFVLSPRANFSQQWTATEGKNTYNWDIVRLSHDYDVDCRVILAEGSTLGCGDDFIFSNKKPCCRIQVIITASIVVDCIWICYVIV